MFEAIRKLYRNTLFRLSLLGAFLFVGSLFVAMGYVYFATIQSEIRRVDKALVAEFSEFQTIFEEKSLQGVDREVILRSASSEGWYILIAGNIVAGNLAFQKVETQDGTESLIPAASEEDFQKIEFTYSNPETTDPDFQGPPRARLSGAIKNRRRQCRSPACRARC